MASLELKAQNIKCGGCASAIQGGLRDLPGIEQVDVDIDTGTVTVSGHGVDPNLIQNKLSELGYPLAG